MTNEYYKQLAIRYKADARLKKCTASIHVEAEADKIFWTKIFSHYLPQYKFNFITFTRTSENKEAKGCKTCLKYFELGCFSKDFVIAIDSDYRYLLQEKNIDVEHFVFQTYTYSIENHYCYHENAASIFEKYNFTNNLIDIKDFTQKISELLYLPLLHNLLRISKTGASNCESDFRVLISDIDFSKLTIPEIINDYTTKIETFTNKYTITETTEIKNLAQKCTELGLNKENAYLYVRGHNIYSSMIKLIKNIHNQLEKDRAKNFSNADKTAYYSQKRKNIEETLQSELYFDKYDALKRIKLDTQKYKQLYTT